MGEYITSVAPVRRQGPTVLYQPAEPGKNSRIGVVVMHSDGNYLRFLAATELAGRGYTVLAANVKDPNASLDAKIIDVGNAVNYLKTVPGVEKVLLLGHSGGATLMSAYQRAAENGVDSMKGDNLIAPCTLTEDLAPADGVMFLDSNFGNGVMALISLEPSYYSEDSTRERDPQLDLFNPAFGYDPNGSHYTEAFKARFFKAQAARANALIQKAKDLEEDRVNGKSKYEDEVPMDIAGAFQGAQYNKLIQEDLSLLAHTKGEWPLLHGDGTITHEQIRCLRVAHEGELSATSFQKTGIQTTAGAYLRSVIVRPTGDYHIGEDGVYGIDWDSTYCCTPSNVSWIHVPTLIMGMTGSYEYLASELLNERSAAADKTLAFVAGASHVFTPERAAEKTPGEFGDTVKVLFDYVDQWIQTPGRFDQ